MQKQEWVGIKVNNLNKQKDILELLVKNMDIQYLHIYSAMNCCPDVSKFNGLYIRDTWTKRLTLIKKRKEKKDL